MSDNDLIDSERNKLLDDKEYHLKQKIKIQDNKVKMNMFLREAKAYKPPTESHKGIAKFMIEQLDKTIDFDCDESYHVRALKDIEDKLGSLNVDNIRHDKRTQLIDDINYHSKKHAEELERCSNHNQWYEDFINSLQ